jgi:hypothetical protein
MNCEQCEEKMSDYVENGLTAGERQSVELHLRSCRACNDMLAAMKDVISWGRNFPIYEPPEWLPGRIIANTPSIARETWLDTLGSIGRWIIEPRTALSLFTASLVLGWLGSIANISPNWSAIIRDPATIYYEAVGAYYRSPLGIEIQSRIEQFLENS